MRIPQVVSVIFFLFPGNFLFAGSPVAVQSFINHKDWSFVENKGQLATPTAEGKSALTPAPTLKGADRVSDVKFYSHEGGAHIYCRPNKISFVFTKRESDYNPNISEATGMEKEPFSGFPLPKVTIYKFTLIFC